MNDLAEKNYQNVLSSPKARKFAREVGVDVRDVVGSERLGRVIEKDIKEFVSSKLNKKEAKSLLAQTVVEGGMKPKLESCMEAISTGVRSCHIIDGRQPHAVLLEVLTDEGIGTMITSG